MSESECRNASDYQIKSGGRFIKISEASREEIEQELMRSQDLIQALEDKLTPLVEMLDRHISGKDQA